MYEVIVEETNFWTLYERDYIMKAYLSDFNFILMELWEIDVKVQFKDVLMIYQTSDLSSYESLISSLSIQNIVLHLESLSRDSIQRRCVIFYIDSLQERKKD